MNEKVFKVAGVCPKGSGSQSKLWEKLAKDLSKKLATWKSCQANTSTLDPDFLEMEMSAAVIPRQTMQAFCDYILKDEQNILDVKLIAKKIQEQLEDT